jgi:hypothetical protein
MPAMARGMGPAGIGSTKRSMKKTDKAWLDRIAQGRKMGVYVGLAGRSPKMSGMIVAPSVLIFA